MQAGAYRPRESWRFIRRQTYVGLVEASGQFDCIQLRFVDDTQQVVFGEFLNQSDRLIVLAHLKAVPIQVLK
ncbi:hypothetical protein P4S73_26595 [Paraglaciecola sp. Hal342]